MPLKKLRKEIDKLDEEIVKLLQKRKKTVAKIAKVKNKYKLAIIDKKRERDIALKLAKFAQKYSLKKTFLQKVWSEIIRESRALQDKIKR